MLAVACSSQEGAKVEVTTDPVAVEVAPGESVHLQATVTGTSDTRVSWEVTSGEGTVDDEGLYTAPSQEGQAQVRATSVVDPQAFAHVLVTVKTPPLPLGIAVVPASRKIGVQGSVLFATQLTNGTGKEKFEWVLDEGPQAGHFNVVDASLPQPTRIYTAPSTPGTYHLSVNVAGRPEVVAHATLTVMPESPTPTLHGTIRYSGQKTGKVYVLYAQGDESGSSLVPQVSTRIEGPGAYSLTPILSSTKPTFLMAFLDTQGSSWLNLALDPMVLVPFTPTGEDQVVDLTLADPPQGTALPSLSSTPILVGMADSFLVFFGSSTGTQGLQVELADSYEIAWKPLSGQGTAGSLIVPAGRVLPEYGHIAAASGLAPGTYAVSVTPRRGDVVLTPYAQAVSVQSRNGTGATLSGKVLLDAPAASGAVYVGIMVTSVGVPIYTRVPTTSASVTWSIPGLSAADYQVWALLDADGDGLPERSIPSAGALAQVTVSGTEIVSAPDLSFQDPQPFLARSTTLQQSPYFEEGMAMEGGLFYSFSFQAGGKWPVAVRLTGGQGAPFPFDLASDFSVPAKGSSVPKTPPPFHLNLDLANRWAGLPEGTPLTAEIINNDGSRDSVPFAAPPVMPVPELISPVNNMTTDFSPVFTWALPDGLPASCTLHIDTRDWARDMPVTQRSVTYKDGQQSYLAKYRTYTWMLQLSDGKGDFSRAWDRFYIGLP